MKIIELKVEGFRSIKSQVWSPGNLNVIIGPNASGKSNLIRALEMLSIAARGGLGKYIQREGGVIPLLWDGQTDRILLRAKLTPLLRSVDQTRDLLTYELLLSQLGNSSAYRIENEVLETFYREETGEHQEPLKLLERDPYHAVAYAIDSQRLVAPPASIPDDETLLSVAAGPFSANTYAAQFQQELSAWRIYQTFQTHRAAQIRIPQVSRADTQVSSDGQNLISVLHNLYSTNRDFKTEVNTAMRAAFGDDFDELVFPPAADQRIQMRIRWHSLQRETNAADLSDGTLRFLFLIAVLANPAPPPLIAIDEPEAGLHPSMLPIVAEYARDASQRSQIILTTHSPDFLDAFGHEAPTTTVVERIGGETLLHVLSGDELAYWLKKYTLGELFRSKELEAMR